MASYTAADVKKLREETGAGMMDCKNALEGADGNYDQAREAVKAKGLARADKKAAEREAGKGYLGCYVHATGEIGGVAELLCETDFVARGEEFRELAKEIAMQVAAMSPEDNEELLAQEAIKHGDTTIETLIKELSGKTGEKIVLGRFWRMQIGE